MTRRENTGEASRSHSQIAFTCSGLPPRDRSRKRRSRRHVRDTGCGEKRCQPTNLNKVADYPFLAAGTFIPSDDVNDVGVEVLEVDLRPLAERYQHRPQRLAALGESVGVVACDRIGFGALDDPDGGEEPKPGGEDIRRDLLRGFQELGVRTGTVGNQVSHDEQGPLVPQDVEPGTDRAHRTPIGGLEVGVRAHVTASLGATQPSP